MNEERLEDLLRERGRALDGPVLPVEQEARLRARLSRDAAGAGGRSDPPATVRAQWTVWLAAAAALLLVALGVFSRSAGTRGVEAEVAALESAALISEYREIYGLDADRLPDVDRSAAAESPPATDIVAYATDAEQRAAGDALSAGTRATTAAWYRIAFRPERDCSAIVLRIDPGGEIRREYPDPGKLGFTPNRFAAGHVHVLPRPGVQLLESPGGPIHDYDRGFLRPRSVERLVAVLALRGEPLDEGLERELERFLREEARDADERRARVREWLAERGFSVRELVVRGEQ